MEKPTLFSTAMVLAALEYRKTQTRRLNGLDEINQNPDQWMLVNLTDGKGSPVVAGFKNQDGARRFIKSPWQPKDIIRVRETWKVDSIDDIHKVMHGGKCNGNKNFRDKSCLAYERDERGTWMRETADFQVRLGMDILKPGSVTTDYILGGIDKTIKIYQINSVKWDTNARGLHEIIINANFGYWSEENGVITKKPVLKIVK